MKEWENVNHDSKFDARYCKMYFSEGVRIEMGFSLYTFGLLTSSSGISGVEISKYIYLDGQIAYYKNTTTKVMSNYNIEEQVEYCKNELDDWMATYEFQSTMENV